VRQWSGSPELDEVMRWKALRRIALDLPATVALDEPGLAVSAFIPALPTAVLHLLQLSASRSFRTACSGECSGPS
jgi:hypothetical protein